MGLLVPPNFPLGTLKNRAERDAVGALVDRLSDGWYVIPSVGIFGASRDFEMDIVLVHERDGVAVLEVKGHRPEIVGGVWMNAGEPMNAPAPGPGEEQRLRVARAAPGDAPVAAQDARSPMA